VHSFVDPGYGDYPKVGWIGASHKDPYQDYDFPHMGTDYKEVLHPDADLATYDRFNPQADGYSYYSQ